MKDVDNTPSSKNTRKRPADGVEVFSIVDDIGTQASTSKMAKTVVIKTEKID